MQHQQPQQQPPQNLTHSSTEQLVNKNPQNFYNYSEQVIAVQPEMCSQSNQSNKETTNRQHQQQQLVHSSTGGFSQSTPSAAAAAQLQRISMASSASAGSIKSHIDQKPQSQQHFQAQQQQSQFVGDSAAAAAAGFEDHFIPPSQTIERDSDNTSGQFVVRQSAV